MSKTIRINRKSVNTIKKKMGLKGTGKETDPIIIDAIDKLNEIITIKNISNYILIKNLSLWKIKLSKCKNITIENCDIEVFKILGCYNITVKNSKFLQADIVYCRESTFKNNNFNTDYLDSIFSEKNRKESDKGRDRVIKVSIGLFTILTIISILLFIFLDYFSGFFFLVVSVYPLAVLIYYRDKRKFTKDLGINFFENNNYY